MLIKTLSQAGPPLQWNTLGFSPTLRKLKESVKNGLSITGKGGVGVKAQGQPGAPCSDVWTLLVSSVSGKQEMEGSSLSWQLSKAFHSAHLIFRTSCGLFCFVSQQLLKHLANGCSSIRICLMNEWNSPSSYRKVYALLPVLCSFKIAMVVGYNVIREEKGMYSKPGCGWSLYYQEKKLLDSVLLHIWLFNGDG